MDLGALKDRRKILGDAMKKQSLHLEAVVDMQDDRANHAQRVLDRALKHAETLQAELESGAYDQAQKTRFSKWIENAARGREQEDTQELSMIDEIKETRRRALQEKVRQCEEVVMKCNMRRLELHQESLATHPRYHYKVACKNDEAELSKREWELLYAKGVDYMVEIELGHAPPLKYIVRNLTADNPISPLTVPKTLEEMPVSTPPPHATDATVPPDPNRHPYHPNRANLVQTSSRPLLYNPVGEFVRSIEEEGVIPKGWKALAKIHANREATIREIETYDPSVPNPAKWYDEYGPESYESESYAAVDMCQGIVKDLINDVVAKLYTPPSLENVERDMRMNKKERDALIRGADKAVDEFASIGVSAALMEEIVSDEINDTFQEAFEARKQIHELVSRSMIAAVQGFCETMPNDKPVVELTLAELQKNHLKGAAGEVKAVVKVETPDENMRNFAQEEKRYFDKNVECFGRSEALHLDVDGYDGSVSAVQLSHCGNLVAVGTSKGYVNVWRITGSQLVRKHRPNHGLDVEMLSWSLDSLYLAILHADAEDQYNTQVHICQLTHSNPAEPMGDSSGDFVIPDMVLMTIITANDLRRPGRGGNLPILEGDEGDEEMRKSLSITSLAWHPSFSIFGSPEACVVGLEAGILTKCNVQGLSEPLAFFSHQSRPLAQSGDAAISNEFLQGHTERVVCVETRIHLTDEEPIPEYISVDTQGIILTWRYIALNFTGFGSFKPHAKLRMDLTKAVNEKEAVVELAAVSRGEVVCCLTRQKPVGQEPQADGGALVVVQIGEQSRLKRKIKLPHLKADDACALAIGSEIGSETGLFYGYLCTREGVSVYSMTSGELVSKTGGPWAAVTFSEVTLSMDPTTSSIAVAIKAGKDTFTYKFSDKGSAAEQSKLVGLVGS